jgi:hypothetical protein
MPLQQSMSVTQPPSVCWQHTLLAEHVAVEVSPQQAVDEQLLFRGWQRG